MSARTLSVTTTLAEETRSVGAAFARALPAGSVVSVEGPLGAGKTEFVRGFCAALGVIDAVTSPSYTLVNEYETETGRRILHLDAFRLSGAGELSELDWEGRRDPRGWVLVEWGERASEALPPDHAHVRLTPDPSGDDVRRIVFTLPEAVARAVAGIGAAGEGAA